MIIPSLVSVYEFSLGTAAIIPMMSSIKVKEKLLAKGVW